MTDQFHLFPVRTTERPDLLDADVEYIAGFFSDDRADEMLRAVEATTAWTQESIEMYGRSVPIPRLSAWHGDPGCRYTYSNIEMAPVPWTEPLRAIGDAVGREAGVHFNSVLANLYRHGRDSVAWHSDDEPELGPEPVIASVSLGATRTFQLRRRVQQDARWAVELTHGSLLIMRGPTQRNWMHQVPKTKRPVGPRVNLTYRVIVPVGGPRPPR